MPAIYVLLGIKAQVLCLGMTHLRSLPVHPHKFINPVMNDMAMCCGCVHPQHEFLDVLLRTGL